MVELYLMSIKMGLIKVDEIPNTFGWRDEVIANLKNKE